jgi:hypothetical protein
MEQQTLIYFDNTTGRILATHVQVSVEGRTAPLDLDELRNAYRSFPGEEIDPGRVEVLDVDVDLLGHGTSKRQFAVDLATRRIVVRDDPPGPS